MSDSKVLKGHDLFSSLNVDEMHQLSSFAYVKEFKKDEIIFKTNRPGSHFYILMEGLVYLQLPSSEPGFSLTIDKVEKDELFGISSLLRSPRYTLTARCHKDSKALSIEAKPFRELLHKNCPAGQDIINKVAHIYFTRYLDLVKRLQDMVGQITLSR